MKHISLTLSAALWLAALALPAAADNVAQVRLTDGAFQEWSKTDVVGSVVSEDTFFTLVIDTRFIGYHPLREGVVGPEKRPLARATLPVRNCPRRPIDLSGFDAVASDFGVEIFSNWKWPEIANLNIRAFEPEPTLPRLSGFIQFRLSAPSLGQHPMRPTVRQMRRNGE